jgi:hypothetical protein
MAVSRMKRQADEDRVDLEPVNYRGKRGTTKTTRNEYGGLTN